MAKKNDNKKVEQHGEKGAFASSMIFVGGFILLLYIAIYWLYMVRVDL